MANNIPTPHISAKEGEIAPSILLPGDPLRAKYIAENFLAGAKQFNSTRNMFGYTGFYRDKPISVMGTGMGCASMGIYSHELMNFYGVKKLVRVGTAGAMQKTTHIRDLVLAMGACTRHRLCKGAGASRRLFAAIADFGLLIKAALEAEQRGPLLPCGQRPDLGSSLCSRKRQSMTDVGLSRMWESWLRRWRQRPSTRTLRSDRRPGALHL